MGADDEHRPALAEVETRLAVVWVIDRLASVAPADLQALPATTAHVVVDTGGDDRAALFTATGLDYLHHAGLSQAEAWNLGLQHVRAPWVAFRVGLPDPASEALRERVSALDEQVAVVLAGDAAMRGSVDIRALPSLPAPGLALAFKREHLLASGLSFDARLRPDFAPLALLAGFLLARDRAHVAWVGSDDFAASGQGLGAEPPRAVWSDAASYDHSLQFGHLALLRQAPAGQVPGWLQAMLLQDLQWYFTVDARERAPTVGVDEALSQRFHQHVAQIIALVDGSAIDALADRGVAAEVVQALHAYRRPGAHTQARLDAFDQAKGWVRLRYYWHGPAPVERFEVDGRAVTPVHAKWRCCRYFRRELFSERVVWLPVASGDRLQLRLDGAPVALYLPSSSGRAMALAAPAGAALDLAVLAAHFSPGQGGAYKPAAAWPRLKAMLLRGLAALAALRPGYSQAWIFMDREVDADDNAEHLYRWVKQHRPQHNAWFVLAPDSPDWPRLKAEGFRLIAPGPWCRMLYLNARHVASSHLEPATGGLAAAVFGPLMRWRFCFLQHGVTKDDMSHWFNGQAMDLLVSCTPEEHASVVDDHTPYVLTTREVRRTGFPRHDALLALSRNLPASAVDTLMVMPTWRGNLIQDGDPDAMATFRASDYAQRWRSLLSSEPLRALVQAHGLRIVFMPHPNAVPYLPAFELPEHVQVLTKAQIGIQALMCRSAMMLTDYSSIAFEMACLHRPVLYYQYDRAQFYGGDHNWRPGYFDYDRHGFGPVLTTEQQLVDELAALLANGRRAMPAYLDRMARAFPDRDGQACRRVYEAMLALDAPSPIGAPGPNPQ